MSPFLRIAFALPVLTLAATAASAQSSGYFVPPSAQAPSAEAPSAPVPDAAPAPQQQAAQPVQPQVPNLPALPAEPAPPTAVIGVISVPDVLQKSTAAQGVQAEIQRRQAALGVQAQKARDHIQAEQQQILTQRGKIPDSELEAKEQALQNEVAQTQTDFQEKNQAIQNSGQVALAQIEAELVGIVRQDAQAHGMNLVLHREQVVLNFSAFDITDEATAELNKLLPSVSVPPSVVTPGMAVNPPGQDSGQ